MVTLLSPYIGPLRARIRRLLEQGGTSAEAVATRVLTNSYWATLDPGAPVDFTEGVGRGATLFPQSLFEEQRRRRLLRGE